MNDLRLSSDSGEQQLDIVQSYMGRHYPALIFTYIDDHGLGQTATFQLAPSILMKITELLQSREHLMIQVMARQLIEREAPAPDIRPTLSLVRD